MIRQIKLTTFLCLGTFLTHPVLAYETKAYEPLTTKLGDKSAYTLTKLDKAPEGENSNVFVDYEVAKDGTLTEHYYEVNIPENLKTAYTIGDNPTIQKGMIPNITNGDDINGVFTNMAKVANWNGVNAGDINADFIKNPIGSTQLLYIKGKINNITGDFIYNQATGPKHAWLAQSAILNQGGTINNISTNYIGNSFIHATNNTPLYGTFLFNDGGTINTITGNFINNINQTDLNYAEGIIYNYPDSNINSITGNFINNATIARDDATSGAIHNSYASYPEPGKIGKIEGVFVKNHAVSDIMYAASGAIQNGLRIDSIKGVFVGNYVWSKGEVTEEDKEWARGGAINNGTTDGEIAGTHEIHASIGVIEADFINNHAKADHSYARGGAIYNYIAEIENIYNSNFIGNYVEGNEDSAGGAIYSLHDINITADNAVSLFKDNKANGESNAIYMRGLNSEINLTFNTAKGGQVWLDDAIDGENYNINLKGDGTGETFFNNDVSHVNNFTMADNSAMRLGVNSNIQTNNMTAAGTPNLKIDLDVDTENNKVSTGHIDVANDLNGNYSVIVNALSPDGLRNREDMVVEFLSAPNDDLATPSDFEVARVTGSNYKWTGVVNLNPEDEGTHWYLNVADEQNVAPETIAGIGLHETAYEQTRSVLRNVNNKVAAEKVYCPGCGIYTDRWDDKRLNNGWVIVNNEESSIKSPADTDGHIWGIEAGFDVQRDAHNVLGVFTSYRKGDYDFSGKGKKYYADTGADIDIKSYLAGIYYRYDKNMNWAFGAAYAGKQKAEVSTDDGIANFDTDGAEFGARVEAGRSIALNRSLVLDPSVSLAYTQISFDNATDNVSKEYSWKDLKVLEAEAGLKITQQFDNAAAYIKPSIIQTWSSGDKVKIADLNSTSTFDDQLLGRLELGGRYTISEAVSGYTSVGYTFGDDYNAYDLNLGLSYSF